MLLLTTGPLHGLFPLLKCPPSLLYIHGVYILLLPHNILKKWELLLSLPFQFMLKWYFGYVVHFIHSFIHFGITGVWIQDLMLAMQVALLLEPLCQPFFVLDIFCCCCCWYWGLNLGPTPWATPLAQFFCEGFFQDRVLWTIFLGWLEPRSSILLSSLDYRCEPLVPSYFIL
jgi:hypothetical protein